MTLLTTATPVLEVRTLPQGVVEGYASVFGGVDSHGDTVLPGAFTKSIASRLPVMLWAHRQDAPIGRWTAVAEDSRGLHVEGALNLRTRAGADAFEHLQAGDLNGLSVGFIAQPNGISMVKGVRQIRAVDLHEVSLVALPSDSAARVLSVKNLADKPSTVRQFEQALQDLGFTRREAARIATKGFQSADLEQDEPALPPDELRALAAALQTLHSSIKG